MKYAEKLAKDFAWDHLQSFEVATYDYTSVSLTAYAEDYFASAYLAGYKQAIEDVENIFTANNRYKTVHDHVSALTNQEAE